MRRLLTLGLEGVAKVVKEVRRILLCERGSCIDSPPQANAFGVAIPPGEGRSCPRWEKGERSVFYLYKKLTVS